MAKKTVIIVISVIVSIIVAAGVAVLIWWLVRDPAEYTVLTLKENGFGDVKYTAAFTRIRNVGDVFWWFYPATVARPAAAYSTPLLLWLDGPTGLPPSMLANFGMFGPYDFNMNKREESWIDSYNLLFVDAPIGTGFSKPLNANAIPKTIDEQVDHLVITLQSFYETHVEYSYCGAFMYIFGQGSGAKLALALATRLSNVTCPYNLQAVLLGNGIVSPALALTKLGFYLEEMGYIEDKGRAAIENLSSETTSMMQQERFGDAFDKFISLGKFVNEAGAVAVNMDNIVDKLTNDTESSRGSDYFGQMSYLRRLSSDAFTFMETTVATALGIADYVYDSNRDAALAAVRDTFMVPAVEMVEDILTNTNIKVIIYNGNLDAVSNTPGQLLWVDNLQWNGQDEFKKSARKTFVVNNIIEGYFRETNRLKFFWMNAAGQSVPSDSPVAMKRFLQLATNT